MANVRNYVEVGENLIKVVQRLMANDDLVNLLYYPDKDPLSHPYLTKEQKQEEIFEKLIKVVPRVGPKEDAKSVISVRVFKGATNGENSEFCRIWFSVEIFIPLTQWFIKDSNLRPFAIMSEIKKSLNGKEINGMGKLTGGDFELNFITEEIAAYEQTFVMAIYD